MFKSKSKQSDNDNVAIKQDDLMRVLSVKWWLWRHLYLRAKGLQIEQRLNDANHQSTIDGLMADINDEDRAIFDNYFRSKLALNTRSANQSNLPPDPDEIELKTIDMLIREAEGRDHDRGLGLVPSKEGEYDIVPPEVDPRTLTTIGKKKPSAGGNSEPLSPARKAAIIAIIVLVLGWLGSGFIGKSSNNKDQALPQPSTIADLDATPTPLEDVGLGSDVTVSYPASLEIERDLTTLVLPVRASASKLGGVWEPSIEDGKIAWLNGTYINHVFCLPASIKDDISQLKRGDSIQMRTASGTINNYEVVRVRMVGRQQTEIMDQRRAGLTLIQCGLDTEGQNQRMVVEAIYTPQSTTNHALRKGDQGQVSDLAKITVKSVIVDRPDDSMPSGHTIVTINTEVENLTSIAIDSSDIADQLQLNGLLAERLPALNSDIDAHAKRLVSYRYFVPINGATALWQATAATGEQIAYSLSIPAAPAAKPAPFTAAIDQESVRIRREDNKTIVFLTIIINATEETELTRDMFTLWTATRSQTITPQEPLPITVPAGTKKPIVIAATLPDVAQFEIQIGGQRWRVSLP